MKSTEIITMNNINTTPANFKDERLAKYTQRIISIYNDAAKYAESKNREIAKILGEISEKKAYEKDGFKSVAEYANSVFGIATQNAYALASAGKIYNDKNANPELQAMSPSKISEIKSLDEKVIDKAIKDGKINRNTTQKELREFAKSAKENVENTENTQDDKPIVLDTFEAHICTPNIDLETENAIAMPRTIEEWDDYFKDFITPISEDNPIEIIKLKNLEIKYNGVKKIAQRHLYLSRNYSLVVEFYKYKAPKAKKAEKFHKFTRDELIAMLNEIEDENEKEAGTTGPVEEDKK